MDWPAEIKRLRHVLARLEAGEHAGSEAARHRSLQELAAGPLGHLITTSCRVMPRQARAVVSVERLLTAGEYIVRQRRRIDVLTIESVAGQAGLTPQAAYRYFADIGELITLAVRRVLVIEHERLLQFISTQVFESEGELAIAATAFIIRAFLALERTPPPLRQELLKDYCDLSSDAFWVLSELARANLARVGGPCAQIGVVQLAAGLTAATAIAKLFALKDPSMLRQPSAQSAVLASFMGALRPPSECADGDDPVRPLEPPALACYAYTQSGWSVPG